MKKQILSKVFGILGIEPVMEPFEKRILYQKIVYLLQSSLSLGYGFTWYVRGPYSPHLTRVLFDINPETYSDSQNINFKNHEKIEQLLEDFKNKLGDKLEDPIFLEVLASLHYLNKERESDLPFLKHRLLSLKPNLKEIDGIDDVIQGAYDKLPEFN
ncbi:MAG: hypothetical protein KAI99_02720 [Cyclobacteriaceae bacterium]|nr:hypothetical protein [Cyclobacteriaceae bacterium]